jgi:transposase-like protein
MKRKVYTQEMKGQIIKEVEETGSLNVVARRHEVAPSTVSTWMKRSKGTNSKSKDISSTEVNKHVKEIESENDQLKKILGEKDLEIAILRDLLKKTNSQPKIR